MWVPPSEAQGFSDAIFLDELNDICEACSLKPIQPSGGPSHCECLRGNPFPSLLPPRRLPSCL